MTSWRWVMCALIGVVLTSCNAPSTTPTPTVAVIPAFPELQLSGAPEVLCREATQLRLEPLLQGVWPTGEIATWQLVNVNADGVLTSGEWMPVERDWLVTFPKGRPLEASDYRVVLRAGSHDLLSHTFTVLADAPTLDQTQIHLTPNGPVVDRLPERARVFYIHFRYAGVCPGAPLWLSVSNDSGMVCNHTINLPELAGDGAVACYREDGAPFQVGTYSAKLTLGAVGSWDVDFEVGAEPTPPPPPPTYATRCDPLFVAAALDSTGKPLLIRDRFEWYTQAIYVGAMCYDLPPAAPWKALWYREGALVREFQDVWTGGSEGVLWDSHAGTLEAPFLRFGMYSVTLTISATAPSTTTFRVIAYTPPATNP